MTTVKLDEGLIRGDSAASILDSVMDAGGGLLRLTPTRVPRSFLHPGRRIKLDPKDYDRFGADRGGVDERWFGSTTDAANGGQVWHEGQRFCLFQGKKFMLNEAVAERGNDIVGENTSDEIFISHVAATGGVEVEIPGTEPLVGLWYSGPNTHDDLPTAGS